MRTEESLNEEKNEVIVEDNCQILDNAIEKKLEEELFQRVVNYYEGIVRRRIVTSEIQMLLKFIEYGFPYEVITYAFEKTLLRINQPSLRYIDKLLERFKSENLYSVEDIQRYEENLQKKHHKRENNKNFMNNNMRKMYDNSTEESLPMRDANGYNYSVRDIKPCPFCGESRIGVKYQYSSKWKEYYMMVECSLCNASSKSFLNFSRLTPENLNFWKDDSVDKCVEAWNRRC